MRIAVFFLLFVPALAYSDSALTAIEGYWNQPGAGIDKVYEWNGYRYAGNLGTVVIGPDPSKSGVFLWVPGLQLKIEDVEPVASALKLTVVRSYGTTRVDRTQSGVLVVHVLTDDKIWFEALFPKSIFEEVFGGAFLELGPKSIYVRAARVVE